MTQETHCQGQAFGAYGLLDSGTPSASAGASLQQRKEEAIMRYTIYLTDIEMALLRVALHGYRTKRPEDERVRAKLLNELSPPF